jgi:hypothetical protein
MQKHTNPFKPHEKKLESGTEEQKRDWAKVTVKVRKAFVALAKDELRPIAKKLVMLEDADDANNAGKEARLILAPFLTLPLPLNVGNHFSLTITSDYDPFDSSIYSSLFREVLEEVRVENQNLHILRLR